jgi:hypothetical protein
MEHDTQNNPSTLRDYDKDPIVIEDYNPLFLALWTISAIPIVILIYIFNPGSTSSQSLSFNVFVIIPMLMFPYIYGYLKTKGKRKIILTEQEIGFFHDDISLEAIKINAITEIKKTYSDLYHGSQYPNEFGKFMSYVLFPIALYMNSMLLINKLLFHIYKDGYKSYRFYDAIIVFSNEKFINILSVTADEYNQVEKYFRKKKQIEISTTKTFYDFFGHMPEKINLEGDK